MTDTGISPRVAQSLADKLEAFATTLNPDELHAFELVEAHIGAMIGSQGNDVQGYMMSPMSLPDAGRVRQQEFEQEASRERLAMQATGGTRRSFWQTIVSTIATRERSGSAPQLRPATGSTTAD